MLNSLGYIKIKDIMSRYCITGWPVPSSLLLTFRCQLQNTVSFIGIFFL